MTIEDSEEISEDPFPRVVDDITSKGDDKFSSWKRISFVKHSLVTSTWNPVIIGCMCMGVSETGSCNAPNHFNLEITRGYLQGIL